MFGPFYGIMISSHIQYVANILTFSSMIYDIKLHVHYQATKLWHPLNFLRLSPSELTTNLLATFQTY